ncbi:hypothetical protein D9756_008070 [Leucocoprinus leucothites]|uniref:Uncharacterized protein n=1 Tax=Leucocoprinus leucothites TaxID=201217 RepID=A0A8H5FYC0_9AGAR|nr:hypothetical protein D9756_008070 [Leucoagaricus leucothites]
MSALRRPSSTLQPLILLSSVAVRKKTPRQVTILFYFETHSSCLSAWEMN